MAESGTGPPRLLGIAGSLRANSYNVRLLEAARECGEGLAELEISPQQVLRGIPPFDAGQALDPPEAVVAFAESVGAADGLLFSTPEYGASIPGVLKNALDWLSCPRGEEPIRDKPTAVIGASRDRWGADWAQADARKVLDAAGARVVPTELPVPCVQESFNAAGELIDEELRDRLSAVISELLLGARRLAPVG